MNKKSLAEVLIIQDLKKETIFDVVGRMKVLLEYFKRNPKHKNLVPFLKTYYLITKSVAERSLEREDYFHNTKKLHELDAYFADLYFRPLKEYLLNKKFKKPWQTYFRYCERKDGIPFVQMLLGINAHINSDLLTSVVNIKYTNRKDFLTINKILKEEIPNVMKFLVRVDHDIYGLGSLFFKSFALQEFRHVIVKWRGIVWRNKQKYDKENYKKARKVIHNQTEEIGKEIIRIFENLAHFRNLSHLVQRMNNLGIKS